MHHVQMDNNKLSQLSQPKTPSKSDAWTDGAMTPAHLEWRQEEEKILLEHLKPSDYVADFCCGDGRLISHILARASRYAGCDCDLEPISRAQAATAPFGDRVELVQCDFKLFAPRDGLQRPHIALCMGNSLAALPYTLSDALSHLAANSTREVFASVIRKGTLEIRKEYYELLGIPYTCDESAEIFHSPVWGDSAAFSPNDLEVACAQENLAILDMRPVGKLGLILTATANARVS